MRDLHARSIVIDGHADTTQRLLDPHFDIGRRHRDGSVDIPRIRDGGLDAIFFAIWMPGTITGPAAVTRALAQIDAVLNTVRTHPDDLTLATTAGDIRRAHAEGKIALLMGVEGGHLINENLDVLRRYAALGVRYLTLTHTVNTTWADASTDTPRHGGLTGFGRDVVRELNRLGVMVDVSHLSDRAFADVLDASTVPVIASHSSCRAISNAPRNLTDDMLRALSRSGGVAMINFHASFLSEAFRVAPRGEPYDALLREAEQDCGADDEGCRIRAAERVGHQAMRSGLLPAVGWETIVEHIDHAVTIAGVDHVGLGSDFDGATMPLGMEDASKLPAITAALLRRGYSETDVEKVLGGNTLRVMEQTARS